MPCGGSAYGGNIHVHLSRKPEGKGHAVAVGAARHRHHRCGTPALCPWDRRRHQYRYRREKDREYEENTISLDQPVPNGKGMLFHEVVAAETDNTEAMAVHLHELTVLHAALEGLDSEEKPVGNVE